ncbi:MAG TPA: hypothetical protein VFK54_02320 [Candidatus Limnocylindrales bacterium]|nr:hypothetical protein [Candidatus Limnocylindrales bacterium]
MSATEFAFLALGLLLGTATGAALVVVLRARPPAPREVRVTVAPPALARPATTLAHPLPPDLPSAMDADPSWPVPDDAPPAPVATAAAPEGGSARHEAGAGDAAALPPGMDAPRALALGLAPSRARRAAPPDGTVVRSGPVVLPERTVPVPIEPAGSPPTFPPVLRVAGSRDGVGATAGAAAGPRPAAAAFAPAVAARSVAAVAASPDTPTAAGPQSADPRSPEESAMTTPMPGSAAATADPCAEPRRLAVERRELADRAAAQARTAAESLRRAHRSYDEQVARADQAERDADPRAIRTAKDLAQRTFHEARARASTPEAREAAARTWLQEINAINLRHREARATLERARAASHELLPEIERLGLEADAARIAAESAAAVSLEASEALAACEEAAAGAGAAPVAATVEGGTAGGRPGEGAPAGRPATALEGLPTIVSILRGDERALDRVVAAMAAGDPDEARHWRLRMATLVDAITARAIESAYLDFPAGHRFWGPFTQQQCRDIAAALGSLGFRYDGLGGFADERVPGQRDLSLAVGYAGLDPMRIRIWPSEAEMPLLYQEAVVAADEWLAEAGGELTLGEMVDALGRRAEELADVWNAWGRLRPLLLADA